MNTLFKTVTRALPITQKLESVVPFQKFENVEHKILIEELSLDMLIGILEEEKAKPQKVLISLEININPKSDYQDNIENTVSYADIIEAIESLAASQHFNLVETFAEEIAQVCLKHPSVIKVNLSVKKPDIISNTVSVGFAMSKSKVS